MSVIWWLALLLAANLELSCWAQVTRVTRTERLLRRQRRYLSFPTGSNLVVSFSFSPLIHSLAWQTHCVHLSRAPDSPALR